MIVVWTIGVVAVGFPIANLIAKQTSLRNPEYSRTARTLATLFKVGLVIAALGALLDAAGK